jgi:hypothetical protein
VDGDWFKTSSPFSFETSTSQSETVSPFKLEYVQSESATTEREITYQSDGQMLVSTPFNQQFAAAAAEEQLSPLAEQPFEREIGFELFSNEIRDIEFEEIH